LKRKKRKRKREKKGKNESSKRLRRRLVKRRRRKNVSIANISLGWTSWNASDEKERKRLKRRKHSPEKNPRLIEMVQPDQWSVTETGTGGDHLAGISRMKEKEEMSKKLVHRGGVMIGNVNVMLHHQTVTRNVIRTVIGVVVAIAEMTVSVMSVPVMTVSVMNVLVTIVSVMIAPVIQVQAGPGDEKTVTEKGLGMKDHLGGGLATEMDPQDVIWIVEEWMTVDLGGGKTVTVLPQADGVIVTVIVTNVTVPHQVLGVRVMTADEMIVGATTDGETIVDVTIVVVTTDGVTTVDAMTVVVMIVVVMTVVVMTVVVMTVDVMTVDAMTVDAMTATDRWLGGGVIEMNVTVHQEILGALIVTAVIGIVEAVKETALEEIAMIVIALGGGASVLMTVTVTVIRGELEGMSQTVISGDENHPLRVLKENRGQRPVAVANDPLQSNLIQRVGQQFSTNEHFTLPWRGPEISTSQITLPWRRTEIHCTSLLDLISTVFQPTWI